MWTEQTRRRMAKIAKKTKQYPSDLTDEEWERISSIDAMNQTGQNFDLKFIFQCLTT
jgi:hypothetical protein